MGMVFNRTIWEAIRNCSPHFCSYDDYNWDWSLQHVSHVCLKNKLHAIVLRGPRVFHIGEWYFLSYFIIVFVIKLLMQKKHAGLTMKLKYSFIILNLNNF